MKAKYSLEVIIELLKKSKHVTDLHDWFFPGDIVPHSAALKYACNKLAKQGKLEKRGSPSDRWGYQYKIINL